MSVYKNNKDGTLSMIATDVTIENAHTEDFLTKSEFSAVTPNDISSSNKLVAENEVTKTVDTMPTASSDLVGTIVQYVGTTTANYTNGYFYKCVSDGEPTPTYSWQVISFSSDPTNKMNIDGSNASNLVEFGGSFTVGSRLANSTIGTNSVAEGEDNTADGNNAHAEGYNNIAHGIASHAEGQNCTSNGYYSHAEGYGTYSTGTASHTSGRGTRAGYAYQMVCGQYNNNDSTTLFEVGNGSDNNTRSNAFQVYNDGSIACGVNRDNKQGTVFEIGNGVDSSHLSNAFEVYSDGSLSQNNGTDKYKFAKNNNVDGFYDGAGTFHAFGEDRMNIDGSNADSHVTFKGAFTVGSRASGSTVGTNSTAEGGENTASGNYSHAEGYNTTASGSNSHAEGNGTTASGDTSHAEGGHTTASGIVSHAEGYGTTASGNYSHAEGASTIASGNYSHTEGASTRASYSYQHAGGKYNDNKTTTLFEIGNGTANNARSNAFEVYSDGSLSTDNGTTKTKLPVIKTATILANASPATATFTNMPSSGNHLVSFYTSMAGLDYNSISQSGNTVTLTYDTQTVDVTVYCSIVEVV